MLRNIPCLTLSKRQTMNNIKLQEGEKLVTEYRTVNLRGEDYTYLHTYIVDEDGETWTTTELDNVNYPRLYNQYRAAHRYPFPDEITAIRKHYGVSAAMMSQILGFGTNQWRLYEDGALPNLSNARTIAAIRSKSTFLELLEMAKNEIGDKAYEKIRERVSGLHEYVCPEHPSENNGYISLSRSKMAEVVKFFISQLGGVFVTKMNKLLFYSDFLTYRRTGFGLTGLEYRAMQYGPVPDHYGEVYSRVDGVDMEDFIYPNGTSGQLLQSSSLPDMSVFTETETEVLSEVCERFKNATSGEISEASHDEKGWKECSAQKSLIPYSYAFDLSMK